MEFIDEAILSYATAHAQPEDPVLQALAAYTTENIHLPNMLSGHLQGRFLALISRLVAPNRILEIGTYTGYSAICLAEGLAPSGHLHTIDVNADLAPLANEYFGKAGIADRVTMHIGNARNIIPTLTDTFDLVFIDADKAWYSHYFDLVIDKVRKGGLIIADNVLWSGRVLAEEKDKRTAALDAYNKKIRDDERVTAYLLPLRDGLNIAQKIV